MSGAIGLLYVGCVLLLNGVGGYRKIDPKALAVMNFFTGGLYMVINGVNLYFAILGGASAAACFGIATSLLFGFTYLYVGFTNLFGLDGQALGWYCFFVGVNTIPCSILTFQGGDWRFGIIWLIWGALWLLFWTALGLKKNTGKHAIPFGSIFVGVVTCWIPGFLQLTGMW